MKYMLITVIDREILTEQFATFEEAHEMMMDELRQYGGVCEDYLHDEEMECEGEFGYSKWSAYNHNWEKDIDCDWLIVEIQQRK